MEHSQWERRMAAAPEWPPETRTAGFLDPPRGKPPIAVGAAAWNDDTRVTFVRRLAATPSGGTRRAAVDS